MSKTALVLVAPGSEEIEFVVAADVLVRGGIQVTTAGVPDDSLLKCSRGVHIKPDIGVCEAKSKGIFDIIILPGGLGGSNAMGESKDVGELLKEQECSGRWIAAICAAPVALASHGIGIGKNVTCYPTMWSKMQEKGKYNYLKDDKVVVDGNIITSQGPATSFEFALTIVEKLVGKEKAAEVAKGLLLTC
nr:protein dj-1beta-like [Leptinotarsa decemlineata]